VLNGIVGKILRKVQIGNPICSVLYSETSRTLIVGFARVDEDTAGLSGVTDRFKDGGVTFLSYPELYKVLELGDSSTRGAPLHICLTPEKKTLVAGCASPEEPSLRFWKCFRGSSYSKIMKRPGKALILR